MSFNRDAYLMHYNHNHDKLGRFTTAIGSAGGKVGSSVLSSGKKKKAPPKADIKRGKTKGSKSNNTKLSKSDRERIINSGTAKEVSAHKDKLSNRELETVVKRLEQEKLKRIDIEKKLSELNNPESQKKKKTAIDRLNSMKTTFDTLANTAEAGTKAYNAAAKIHNAKHPNDKWPVVGEKDAPMTSSSYAKYLINDADPETVWKNKSRLRPDERQAASDRIKVDMVLEGYKNKAAEKNGKADKKKERKIKKKVKEYKGERLPDPYRKKGFFHSDIDEFDDGLKKSNK